MLGRALVVSPQPRAIVAGCFAALSVTGCGSNVAPVSGRVLLNGQPLAGAVVTFQPHIPRDSGQPRATGSVGRTDSQGRFALRMIDPDRAGAAIGEHSVTISTSVGGSDSTPPTGTLLPKVWRDGSKRFQVPAGGTSAANFEIKSP